MSSESFYESSLARGLVLKEQGRYAEAENYFRRALSADPDNSEALNFLAGCQLQQGRSGEALSTITDAIAREPNEADYHALQAIILSVLDRPKDAAAAAMRGLALEPSSLFAINALTQTYLSQRQWARAEESARKALSLDADNSSAANFLALALRMQNKWDENAEQIRGLLARDPENAYTHRNAGYSALSRGDTATAETHFRESLRLDPDHEAAREGLLQSFKGRNWLYRRYLAYFSFMEKHSGHTQLLIVVGLMLGAKTLNSLLTGPYRPLGYLVVLAYVFFVLFSHIGRSVGNLFLLADRFARYVLRREEKVEAVVVGAVLLSGSALGIAGLLTSVGGPVLKGGMVIGAACIGASLCIPPAGDAVLMGSILLCGASIPLCHIFTNRSRAGVALFGCVAAFAIITGLLSALTTLVSGMPQGLLAETSLVALITLVISTWLVNLPALQK